MASILSLSASSPLREPYSNHSFRSAHGIGRSYSFTNSRGSSGTVQHNRLRSLSSGSSISSLTSLVVPAFIRHDDRGGAPRSLSSHNLSLRRQPTGSDQQSLSASVFSRRTSFASVLSARRRSDVPSISENEKSKLLDVAEDDYEPQDSAGDELSFAEKEIPASVIHDVPLPTPSIDEIVQLSAPATVDTVAGSPNRSGPRRWLSTLKRRKQHRPMPTTPYADRISLDDFDCRPRLPDQGVDTQHKKSDSWSSSLHLVTVVRSATATLASMSIATVSRRNANWRRDNQRSSIISGSNMRPSVDSQRSVMDEAAKQRSRRRRNKLEELIRSEESYVADLKALSNAYFTILGHQPTVATFTRTSAQQIIADILHLHDDLLGHLHRLVPFAEYDRRTARAFADGPPLARSHTRWHSIDVVSSRGSPARPKLSTVREGRRSLNISRTSEHDPTLFQCSPQIVTGVTELFLGYITRFNMYEDFGINYDLMLRDVDETRRSTLSWSDFDKAIEALSAHVNPVKSREVYQKKAMTIKDLLIKPIQRLPRYELLFNDLCKLTPVCDDPDANAMIQELLIQLGDACQRVNEAKDNPVHTRTLEATWLLGDRLSFSNQVPKSVFLQLLGRVSLCGCLYIAYRGKSVMKGRYTICILFDSTLLIASPDEDGARYAILAGVPLANTTVVESDNGKGLQCHTAPHCWKIVFEHSARMYEIILAACSAIEANVWREQLGHKIEAQIDAVADGRSSPFELQSPILNDMRSVGKAFGKPGSFVRRMSVHRAATVGPNTDLNQVIIKNTQAVKESVDGLSQTSLQLPRSLSVATPSHVQTLAPRRADRIRLESLLSDVWTKDLLPYPGMQPRLSDPIRASANHVIRKFSMVSITSNFSSSKRSASYTSIQSSRKEDMAPAPRKHKTLRHDPPTESSKAPLPPLVDFHTAPEAFLPPDFELQDPTKKRKKSAFRALTMTMERPFSPLLGNESKHHSGLRRAQSVHNVHRKDITVPASSTGKEQADAAPPVYSVVQERVKTPANMQRSNVGAKSDEMVVPEAKQRAETINEPKKSKSRNKLLRLLT